MRTLAWGQALLGLALVAGLAGAQDAPPAPSPEPSASPAPAGLPTLAVLPLRFAPESLASLGDRTEVAQRWLGGTALTGKLTADLVSARRFRVVEREEVEAIVRELDLSERGLADPSQLPRGHVLPARYLIAGEVTTCRVTVTSREVPFADGRQARKVEVALEVALRVIDAQTSQLRAAEPVRLDLLEALAGGGALPADLWERLQRELARRLRNVVVDAVYPIRLVGLDGAEFLLDRGRGEGLQVGDRLEVYAGTGERRLLGELEVTRLGEQRTWAKVVSGSGMSDGDECRRRPRQPGAQPPSTRPAPEGW